jgi:hypothetical protein
MADYYDGKGNIPEGKCFTNDAVQAFHTQLTVNGIAFPTPMDSDQEKEIASWVTCFYCNSCGVR